MILDATSLHLGVASGSSTDRQSLASEALGTLLLHFVYAMCVHVCVRVCVQERWGGKHTAMKGEGSTVMSEVSKPSGL